LIRLGRIDFLHNSSTFFRLERDKAPNLEVVSATPRMLLQKLLDDQLDVAPIATVNLLPYCDRLRIVPAMCLHSMGASGSTVVVRLKNAEIPPNPRVGVTSLTDTTQFMLRRILSWEGIKASFEIMDEKTAAAMLTRCDLALVIGDVGLRARFDKELEVVFDVGESWTKHVNLPAVFAISSTTTKALKERPEIVKESVSVLTKAVADRSLNEDIVAESEAIRLGLSITSLKEYFQQLSLDYNENARRGLQRLLEELSPGSSTKVRNL